MRFWTYLRFDENLAVLGLDAQWLHTRLQNEQLTQEGIFLMTATKGGETYVVKKEAAS